MKRHNSTTLLKDFKKSRPLSATTTTTTTVTRPHAPATIATTATATTKKEEPKLFTKELQKTLQEEGAVVIPQVLDREICGELFLEMKEYYKNWMQGLKDGLSEGTVEGGGGGEEGKLKADMDKLNPENAKTWMSAWRPAGSHGLVQFDGHQSFCWKVRQHPRVVQVFAEYYQVKPEDLLVSFDGWRCIIKGTRYLPGKSWAHVDQSPNARPPCTIIQTSISLQDSDGAGDGDFVYWKKSNLVYQHYFKLHPEKPGKIDNFIKWDQDYIKEMEKPGSQPHQIERVHLQRKAGDMVVWFSTTLHQSDPPSPNCQNHAAVTFVSMAPRKFATAKDLNTRLGAFEKKRTTAHWPIYAVKMFPATPRLYDKENVAIFQAGRSKVLEANQGKADFEKNGGVITPLGRRLIGYP